MKILVSACLVGRNCKYNGGSNYNTKVVSFLEGHEIVEYCPEVMAGMPVPRVPMEILDGRLLDREGNDHSLEMAQALEKAMAEILKMNIDCAILQSRSPTCGVKQIYDGSFSGRLIPGRGLFARALMEAGIRVLDAEDV